jgi:hypothetical protein
MLNLNLFSKSVTLIDTFGSEWANDAFMMNGYAQA